MKSYSDYVLSGFALVPIPTGLKGPTAKDWNKRESAITDLNCAASLSGNVGLAHAYCSSTPTMALDIDDLPRARAWLAERNVDLDALLNANDGVQIVSGRAGRAKLLYRLPEGIDPIESITIKEEVEVDA